MSSGLFAPLHNPRNLATSLSSQLQCLRPTTPFRTFKGRPPIYVDEKTKAKKDTLRKIDKGEFGEAVPQSKSIVVDSMPPYPYGLQSWGNAYQNHPLAKKALLGGKMIISGNKISKGRNKGKTKRKWYPYIQTVKLRSDALDEELTILATRACMRTITKCGGLDQYLLGEKPARIKELGPFGWRLRWLVMNQPSMRQRFDEERNKLGIRKADTFEEAISKPEIMAELLRVQVEALQTLKEQDARFTKHVERRWAGDKRDYQPAILHTLKNLDPTKLDLSEQIQKLSLTMPNEQQ